MITSDWPARVEKKAENSTVQICMFFFFLSYVGGWLESIYKKDGFCVCCLRNMILEVG